MQIYLLTTKQAQRCNWNTKCVGLQSAGSVELAWIAVMCCFVHNFIIERRAFAKVCQFGNAALYAIMLMLYECVRVCVYVFIYKTLTRTKQQCFPV
jgi:hypothetical protein